MNHLYEALEQCLNEIEQGADVETVLFRHPALADELRPILEASVQAKSMAVPAPSMDVVRRNRARVLQHAAQMREAKAKPVSRRIWSVPLRRALVTLMVVLMVFVSGTGLVRAASETLPGDNLYPVKRTWENMILLFTFDVQKRGELELEHENKRLEELNELFAMGRSAKVDFAGYLTRQNGDEWTVSNILVLISPQTRLPDEPVAVGAPIRVRGQTLGDGRVLAERIQLLSSGANLPKVDDDSHDEAGNENQNDDDDSGKGSGSESSDVQPTRTTKPQKTSFEGVVSTMETHLWVVNRIVVNISNAEIKGEPRLGATAKVEGYFNPAGVFIAEKIEFKDGGSSSGSGSDSSNANTNTNTSNNNSNKNDNDDNNNDDDNDNDD
jgi:hypothetical protein